MACLFVFFKGNVTVYKKLLTRICKINVLEIADKTRYNKYTG